MVSSRPWIARWRRIDLLLTNKPQYIWIFIVSLVLFALFLRAAIVLNGAQPFYEGDGQRYNEMLDRLLAAGVYSYGSDEPNARVTPGFPLFYAVLFALFGKSETLAVWTQMSISALTVVPVFYTLYRKTGFLLAYGAALGAAIYPPFIFGSGLFLTEPLFLCLLSCFFWAWTALERQPDHLYRLVLCAFLLSWAILTRPGALPIAGIAFLFLWFRRPFRNRAWLFAAGMAVCFAPWILRNVLTLHEFTPLASDSGNALLSGAYPYFQEKVNWKEMYALGMGQTEYGLRVILDGFRTDFFRYLGWFTIGKLQYMFSHLWISEPMRFPLAVKYTGILLHYSIAFSLLVTIPWRMWRRDFIAWSAVSMLMFQLLFIPEVRYASPFLLMGLMLAASGLSDWMKYMYTKESP